MTMLALNVTSRVICAQDGQGGDIAQSDASEAP